MDRALLVMTLLMLSATTALAQSTKTLQFGAGGNTVGGPGTRTLGALGTEVVFLQSAATPMNLCATVVNVGKPGSVVSVQVFDPGMVVNSAGADAREAATACRNGSNQVKVGCAVGDQCQVLWRVDRIP